MYEVNYTGTEKVFNTLEDAIEFQSQLQTSNTGSDIWVNGNLYKSVYKNYFTGEWIVEFWN